MLFARYVFFLLFLCSVCALIFKHVSYKQFITRSCFLSILTRISMSFNQCVFRPFTEISSTILTLVFPWSCLCSAPLFFLPNLFWMIQLFFCFCFSSTVGFLAASPCFIFLVVVLGVIILILNIPQSTLNPYYNTCCKMDFLYILYM